MPSIEDYKRKISGLLAKAEGTDNQHERDSFSAAAERLMIKMGIERAELESVGEVRAEPIVEKTRDWRTIYAPVMGAFASRVGRAYGDLTFMQYRDGKDFFRSYVIGYESDVDGFLTLIESLNLQVWSALKAYRRENRELRKMYTIHENFVTDRSFIEGYAGVVAMRLASMRREEVAEASPGAALVLASKIDKVMAWRDEQNPNMGKARQSRTSQWSSHGANAGRAAGRSARLGETAIGGGRGQIGG